MENDDTKLRRQIYGKLKTNKCLKQLDITEILQNFVKDIDRCEDNDERNATYETDVFHCKCGWILHEPVTLPCGHTFCKYCVVKNQNCLECGYLVAGSFNISPLLVEFISILYKAEYDATGYKIQASNFFSLNRFTEALNSINKAIDLVGDDFVSLNMRVEIYLNLQKNNSALQDAELSCKTNDSCGRSHYIRGLCFAALKEYDQAIDAFQQSLELDPDDEDLSNNINISLSGLLAADIVKNDQDIKKKLFELENLDDNDNEITDTKIGQEPEETNLLSNNSNDDNSISEEISRNLDDVAKDSPTLSELFECKVCYNLLFRPVTLPCGHIFCKNCIEKSLDYHAHCPMCRCEMSSYRRDPIKPVTVIVEDTLQIYLKEEFDKRKEIYNERMETLSRVGIDGNVDHPIFICSVAFPHVRCSFHIFEPRYRQMIRECIESGSRMFGICSPTMDEGYSDIGTMLYIESFKMLNDGGFIIQTEARQRFICKKKSKIDSLDYAKVEYFEDDLIGLNAEEFVEFMRTIYADLSKYIGSLHSTDREFIINTLGEIPPFQEEELRFSPHELPWAWWGLAALPLNFNAKLALLRSKNTVERFGSLKRFLKFMTR